jgi:uncharacterized membrane protein YkvA (DUF1232 family)
MLLDLLKQRLAVITMLEPSRDIPVLAEQIRRERPDWPSKARAMGLKAEETCDEFQIAGSLAMLFIKSIPQTVESMLRHADKKDTTTLEKLVLTVALVYFVQPLDEMPDTAPGGYGFLDDCILLRAAHIDVIGQPAPPIEAGEDAILPLLASMAPVRLTENLEGAVRSIQTLKKVFGALPQFLQEAMRAQMSRDPLNISAQALRTSIASPARNHFSSPRTAVNLSGQVASVLALGGIDPYARR